MLLLNNIFDLLLLAALWLLAAANGLLLVRRLVVGLTALERLLFAAAVGLGGISLGVLLLGSLHLLNPTALLALIGLLFLLTLLTNSLVATLRDMWSVIRRLPILFSQPVTAGLAAAILLAAAATLVGAMAPPTDWDPLIYHLAFPKSYLRAGATLPILFDHRGMLPQAGEMLFTLALAFGRQTLAGLLHWSMGLASAAAVFALCRRHLRAGLRFSLLATAIFYTTPLVLMQSITANIDLNLVFYDTMAFSAFCLWVRPFANSAVQGWKVDGGLVLVGVLAGLAYGCKQTAIFSGAILALLIGWQVLVIERRGGGQAGRAVMGFVAVAGLLAVAWPLRAWLASGNPVWPWLYNVFGGAYWTASDASLQNNGFSVLYGMRYPSGTAFDAQGTAAGQNLLNSYLVWPWNATMYPARFNSVAKWAYGLGPLYLALLPVGGLLGLVRKVNLRSPLALVGLYAGLYLTAWLLFLAHMSRFFISALPELAILVAAAVYALMGRAWVESEQGSSKVKKQRSGRPAVLGLVVKGLVGLAVGLGAADEAFYVRAALPHALGQQTEAEYISTGSYAGPYAAIQWANANLPPTAKVLMGWGAHAYYLDRDYLYAEHVPGYVGRYANRPASDLRQRLRDLGISHIVIANPQEVARRGVFPSNFLADDGPYTTRIYPAAGVEGTWRIYVLK